MHFADEVADPSGRTGRQPSYDRLALGITLKLHFARCVVLTALSYLTSISCIIVKVITSSNSIKMKMAEVTLSSLLLLPLPQWVDTGELDPDSGHAKGVCPLPRAG